MAFPSNPTIGEQHTEYGDVWTYDGHVWNAGGVGFTPDGRTIFIDNATPTATTENIVWYRMDISSIAKRKSGAWNHIPTSVSIGASVAESSNTAPSVSASIEIGVADQTNEDNSMSLSVTFTPNEAVEDGTYNYTITGVSSDDIDVPLTGSFAVTNGAAPGMFITALADNTTEGDETMTITIDETGDSANVTIWDTSTAPPAPAFTVTPSNTGTTEGRTIQFTVTPSGPEAIGTNMTWMWTVIESADIDASGSTYGSDASGVITFADANPFTITFKFLSDGIAEGGGETGYFNVSETGDSFPVFVRDR